MNAIHLIGRLTKDPELKYFEDGTASTTFQLAVRRNYKDKEGNYKSDFIPIQVLGKKAIPAANYLRKGNRCAVDGRLQIDSWKDENGNWKNIAKVMADNVEFLESAQSVQSDNVEPAFEPPADFGDDYGMVDDGDIPF